MHPGWGQMLWISQCLFFTLKIRINPNTNKHGGVSMILEHPEISWIEATGYPSWMQPKEDEWDQLE